MVVLNWDQKVQLANCLQLTIFGYTLTSILQDSSWDSLPRDIGVVEIFSVAQAVCLAATQLGHLAAGYDKELGHPSILTREGFRYALRLVMRLKPGGLLIVAPCCSSWGYANVSNTKRSNRNPGGDRSYDKVRDGNFMARVSIFFYALSILRDGDAILENPVNSWLFKCQTQIIAYHFEYHKGACLGCCCCCCPGSSRPASTGSWL